MGRTTGHVASCSLANWSNVTACSGHVINVVFPEAARPSLLFTSLSLLLSFIFSPFCSFLDLYPQISELLAEEILECIRFQLMLSPSWSLGAGNRLSSLRNGAPGSTVADSCLAYVNPLCLPEIRAQDNPDSSFEL